MTRRIVYFVGSCALWICAQAAAAEVRAWLDRTSMQLGETVTLNVEVSGDVNAAEPDFHALEQDFVLQGTQSSSSVTIVNGQTTAKRLWAVALEPKHEGTLTIPALEVAGQRTAPLTLTVQATPAGGGKAGDEVFLDVSVEPRAPYVQQQVAMTVKLYFAVNLLDGNLDDPQARGLVVRKLGQDANFSADLGGRHYHVLERHYALFAEQSGSIHLAPIAFRGHALDAGDLNSFFSRGRVVAARAPTVTLEVRPRPAASGTEVWLPARAVTLQADGIDAQSPARVGEPITLTLRAQAQGLGFEQLPELKLPAIDGADVYPDKETTRNRDDGTWLFGERERKFAIVPNRPGRLPLPAIRLAWWDTAHDRAATAEVPALTLEVQPAAATAVAPQPAPSATPAESPATAGSASLGVGSSDEARLWRTLALLALALWVATLLGWIVWLLAERRREARPARPAMADDGSAAAARARFRGAVERGDWPAAAHALLGWARQRRPELRNLGELARALADSGQARAVHELERACYGRSADPDLRAQLTAAFRGGLAFASAADAPPAESPLPPLYPGVR